MKQIFPYAFTDCSSLKEITFPDKLEDIQEGAFLQCTSLETVMIGENVKKIGDNAFKNCSKLHCIYYNGTKEPITGKDSFSGVNTSYIMVLNTYNGSSTIGGLNTYVGIINECVQPTGSPTELPTGLPTGLPTESPTGLPTELPTTTYDPSETNTQQPTAKSEESFPNKSEFLDSNGFKSGAAYSILMVIMTLALIL
ncbi:leucine-rich repeat domain-containing protein [Histomonas meleagridis]|uniref:leucine-rich repeat domain-containing protein n=1 Tax=Histomonas meleagridis TaxID=135588 RepID=UPI00355A36E2|nr:leucine-rich repeat domain-containing protein [Histomonas meleagridis]KAH0801523.1 leucine-rich repeat domain-containing protein [Histomonas meleagridis]